jgi:V/A-type H+/Na+-transporting ATPase subunit C
MGMGGVSDYAATNARVRSMFSTMLSEQDYNRLAEADDFDALVNHLKRTEYGRFLDQVKDRELSPRRTAFAVRSRLAEAYLSIIFSAPIKARDLLLQLYRAFEVDNLKAVLRGIVAGASWDRVRYLLFPLGSVAVLPAQEMMESGSVASAVDLLRDTPYYETLSFAMKRYSAEQTLFPLEVALDLNYWRDVWGAANRLTGQDRTQAMRVIGPLLDMTNLMWAIRYRVFHHLSEEELINYTLPFGYHVRDEDIRSIAAGADIARIVERVYPGLRNVNDLLEDASKGLAELEVQLQRDVIRQCRAVLLGNPFHVGVPLAYLILQEMEIQDLVVFIEAKSSRTPEEGFAPYLLMQAEMAPGSVQALR